MWSVTCSASYRGVAHRVRFLFASTLSEQFPKERYAVVQIRKEDGKTTREAICTYVNKAGFDYLVVGMVGRKGPKLDPTILGSTADYSLRSAHCTSAIIKKPTKGANKFVVGVDGSERAHKSVIETVDQANEDVRRPGAA